MYYRISIIILCLLFLSCSQKEDYVIVENSKLIAHRGYWDKKNPQNSINSIIKAAEAGFYAAEIDVQETKDSVLVVFHDSFIDEIPISDLNYNELFLHNDYVIPKLSEFLSVIKEHPSFKLLLDIKHASSLQLYSSVCNAGVANQVMYSSFYERICQALIDIDADNTVFYISELEDIDVDKYIQMGVDGFIYRSDLLKKNTTISSKGRASNKIIISWVIDPKYISNSSDIDYYCVDINSYL